MNLTFFCTINNWALGKFLQYFFANFMSKNTPYVEVQVLRRPNIDQKNGSLKSIILITNSGILFFFSYGYINNLPPRMLYGQGRVYLFFRKHSQNTIKKKKNRD